MKETEDSALHRDTSPTHGYDLSIRNTTKYQGIHCVDAEPLAIGKDYDPRPIIDNQLIVPLNASLKGLGEDAVSKTDGLRTPFAATGSYVIHRKDLFRRYRDHLIGKNEADKLVTHKMGQYVRNTSHFSALYESPKHRSSSIEDASREIERQNTKFTRMRHEMDTLTAYRSELEDKRQLIKEYVDRYGRFFLQLVDSERDMLNLSLEEMRQKYIPLAESARLHVNAVKIQSFWRRRKLLQQDQQRFQKVR